MKKINRLRADAMLVAGNPSFSYKDAWGVGPYIVSTAKSYCNDIQDKKIIVDNPKEQKLLVLPYITRFSDEYYSKKLREISRLRGRNITGGVFLTLTVDPNRFHSLKSAYKALMKAYHKLVNLYRHRLRHIGEIVVIRVVEFQKDGQPHIHAVLAGVKWLEEFESLKSRWNEKYGVGMHVDLRRIWDRMNAISYITKYLRKAYVKGSHIKEIEVGYKRNFESVALGWAVNARIWAVSLLGHKTKSKTSGEKIAVVSEERGVHGGETRVPPADPSGWICLPSAKISWQTGLYSGADRLSILVDAGV